MRPHITLAIVLVAGIAVLSIGGVGIALALENQDSFCASCHTEPEVTYWQQSVATQSTTLAAFHAHEQTACIDCHSGGGMLGRSEGLSQGAHDLMSYLSGQYNRPAVTTNPLGDDSCVKCHERIFVRAGERTSKAMNGHYHTLMPRWQSADSNAARCVSCHTSHKNGPESLLFMSQVSVGQICDQCHAAMGEHDRDQETQ